MDRSILDVLADSGAPFSKRQRSVARYICDNCEKAAFMTASMLAEASGVSESTVVRFATELGFTNYPQLRRALQGVLRGRLLQLHAAQSGERGNTEGETLIQAAQSGSERLEKLCGEAERRRFCRLLELFRSGERVLTVGSGAEAALAEYMAYRLDTGRGGVYSLGSGAVPRLMSLTQGQVLICIGKAGECGEELRLAQERGAGSAFICVGGAAGEARYGELVLDAGSATGLMCLVEALCAESERGEKAHEK